MATVKQTTEYFDAHASRLRADNLVDKSHVLRELFFSHLPPSSAVLEVGAGTGLYTISLLAMGHRVTALDLSERSLAVLRESVSKVGLEEGLSLRAGDFLEQAQHLSAAFDAVTFIKVLHHMPSEVAIEEAFQAAWKLLRPGGRIIVFEPNGSCPAWPVLLRLRGKEHWHNERNVMLIRRRFLEKALERLPGARVQCVYRYVIPGALATRSRALDEIDKRVCASSTWWLDRLAVNVGFEVLKG